jgi:hypothetical protein
MRTLRRWTLPLLALLLVGTGSLATTGCMGRTFISLGTAIDILPGGFVTVTVGTGRYYYHDGIFYRSYRRGYLVVPAPIGAVVGGPPPGHVVVMVEHDPYAYYRGVFYRSRPSGWVVVRPPLGAFVRRPPPGAVTVWIEGVEYKEYAGTYYRRAIRDGERGYQVTERPGRGGVP